MIGLDTNVLIRYIVQDDEQQAKLATDLIENECSKENYCFINEVTLCEVVWVLKRAYHYDKTIILNVINGILTSNEIRVASQQQAWIAYYDYEEGSADFSDYFIAQLNKKFGCTVTISFDKKACGHENFKFLSTSL